MKRLLMAAAVAMAAAVSSPAAAHAQTGCAWWDLTCNGLSNTVTDYGWHAAGRDANGNLVYVRRLVDANGNVVFEQAHRNTAGRYLIGNTHTIRKGTVYGSDGTVCKYNSNDKGYKEDCKYARGTVLAGVRPTNTRSVTSNGDCKYKSNPRGYSEQCKYAKTPKAHLAPVAHPKPVHYEKPEHGKGDKGKGDKGKGPKH